MSYFETVKHSYKTNILLMAVSLLGLMGCKDTITNQQIDDVVIPLTNVSYAKYIQPVLTVKCTYSGCHDDNSSSKSINSLTSYSGTTAGYKYIIPYSPDTSPIVISVKGQGPHPMPPSPSYPGFNANQLDGLRQWIKEGAVNN